MESVLGDMITITIANCQTTVLSHFCTDCALRSNMHSDQDGRAAGRPGARADGGRG